MHIIEKEKNENGAFSKKIEDIDFEVLLARPPAGQYKYKTTDNFDHVDDQQRCKDLWAKWEQLYSWKDDNKDLVDQAVRAKTNQKKKKVNQMVLGYALFHAGLKFGISRYPDTSFSIMHGYGVSQGLRFAKYGVVFGWLYSYYSIANWFLQELKNVEIYDYKTKRQRLFYHMHIANRMWTYGAERHKQM